MFGDILEKRAEMQVSLHRKCPLLLSGFNKTGMWTKLNLKKKNSLRQIRLS
jgi:hypothetical protein